MGIEGDEVLLSRVHDDGDIHAFGCLYERHAPAARRFALSLCRNDADADDLTAEVFTALLASLRRGKGPSQLVLPYVFASIRHRHWRMARRLGHEAAIASAYEARTDVAETTDLGEADVVRTALATLPDDVRLLLWRTEVVDESVDEVVERTGTSAHNVAVSRHRARRALGTAYLAQHAEPDGGLAGLDAECQATLPQLAALVRNKVGVRRRRRIERHLAACRELLTDPRASGARRHAAAGPPAAAVGALDGRAGVDDQGPAARLARHVGGHRRRVGCARRRRPRPVASVGGTGRRQHAAGRDRRPSR